MLNKPPEPSDMMGQAHQPNAAASMHVPQDLVYKLLHVQEVRNVYIFFFLLSFDAFLNFHLLFYK